MHVVAIACVSMRCLRICGNSHMAPSRQPVGFGPAIGARPRADRVLFTARVGATARFSMRCCPICGIAGIASPCQFVSFDAMRGHEVEPPPKQVFSMRRPITRPNNSHKRIQKHRRTQSFPTPRVTNLLGFSAPVFGTKIKPVFWAQNRAQILGTDLCPDSGHRIAPGF